MSMIVAMAAESQHEADHLLSWGVGGAIFLLLLVLLGTLVAFGGGREHS